MKYWPFEHLVKTYLKLFSRRALHFIVCMCVFVYVHVCVRVCVCVCVWGGGGGGGGLFFRHM